MSVWLVRKRHERSITLLKPHIFLFQALNLPSITTPKCPMTLFLAQSTYVVSKIGNSCWGELFLEAVTVMEEMGENAVLLSCLTPESLGSQKLSGIAGSPAYVAPEVLSGHYSEKVDIWGAGVLLHSLLVGTLPFQGDSLEAVFEAIKTVELDFHSSLWESLSVLARDLTSRMLARDVSARMTPDEILGHPWILFYTESRSKALPIKSKARNSAVVQRINFAAISLTNAISSSSSSSLTSSSRKSEEQDEYGFVDVLAAAISRVRISEPKRSRLCLPASPIQQECSSNRKASLCTAF